MRHHIPVAAKREVLRHYRWNRERLTPYYAMDALMHRFAVEYTDRESNGDKFGKAQQALDRYRAARWYLYSVISGELGKRLYDRAQRQRQIAARTSEITWHRERLAELESAR